MDGLEVLDLVNGQDAGSGPSGRRTLQPQTAALATKAGVLVGVANALPGSCHRLCIQDLSRRSRNCGRHQ